MYTGVHQKCWIWFHVHCYCHCTACGRRYAGNGRQKLCSATYDMGCGWVCAVVGEEDTQSIPFAKHHSIISSGLIINDVSDHLPIFAICKYKDMQMTQSPKFRLIRKTSYDIIIIIKLGQCNRRRRCKCGLQSLNKVCEVTWVNETHTSVYAAILSWFSADYSILLLPNRCHTEFCEYVILSRIQIIWLRSAESRHYLCPYRPSNALRPSTHGQFEPDGHTTFTPSRLST